jgi:P27 family predicted phage terminase small subunit
MVDRAALASYCQWWARWVEAEATLDYLGMVFTTPNGYIQQRPEVAIAQKASDKCRAFLTEFGLTPASRSRIKLPDAGPPADPFEAFLKSERLEDVDGE